MIWNMTDASRTEATPQEAVGSAPGTIPTYLNFLYFKVDPSYRRLPDRDRFNGVAEFKTALKKFEGQCELRLYSTVGLRAECDFLIWFIGKDWEVSSRLVTEIFKSGFGRYLSLAYTFSAVTKPTPYFKRERPQNFERGPSNLKWMFVYPFAKTNEWYQLPLEDRTKMMGEHRAIGTKFEKVLTNTAYSFGFGDYDFLLAFETDDPREFNDLVQRLREAKARPYTKADTPLIPCVLKKSVDELIDSLGVI